MELTTRRFVQGIALLAACTAIGCGDGGGSHDADGAPGATPTPTVSPRPGTLDAAFGAGGVALTDFSGRGDVANAIAIQPDGRIVAAGQSLPQDGKGAFAIVRHLPDGTLDASFGDGGRVLTPPAQTIADASAIAVDAAGRIVVAGPTIGAQISAWQIVRLTTTGAIDESFGTEGVVAVPDAAGTAVSIALEPDGAILVAGTRYAGLDAEIAVARFLEDGRLDDGFGAGGIAAGALGSSVFGDLALGPDGTIVVAGVGGVVVDGFSQVAFLVARLRRDGTPDPGFGDGGIVVTAVGPEVGRVFDVEVAADGSVVATGYVGPRPSHGQGFGGPLLIARYEAAGALAEVLRTGVPVADASTVLVEPGGGFFVGDGKTAGEPFAAARIRKLDAHGVLDASFGDGGAFVQHLRPGDESGFRALALQPDGRLVAAGFSRLTLGDYDFALARLWR